MKFYNTLSRKKEEFISIQKNIVKVYSCGPTVYSSPHIGNLRAAIFIDVLKRVLRYFNYKVIDVINITDVGHLVSDEDDGEDKMLKAAKKENKNPFEIAKYYESIYKDCLVKLNIIPPKYMPRATDHIKEQINIIKDLEFGKYTYTTSDGVYFDVSKFKNYGMLSGQNLDQKKAGARVEVVSEKKNPQDFALWKFLIGDNSNHLMKWESPWGIGFPGWHIECSAMSNKYLGNKFDIHTGGIDHIPVHHENEIAQNICSNRIKNINYWMHNAFFLVDGERIAKSLNNGYTLQNLIDKGYSALALRELCMRTHYRKQSNFTFESLGAGEVNIKKINDFYYKFENIVVSENSGVNLRNFSDKYLDKFDLALKDDLNTSLALSVVFEFMSEINRKTLFSNSDKLMILNFMKRTDSVLALLNFKSNFSKELINLANERKLARENKDWTMADKLRIKINNLGYIIKDSNELKEGYLLSKI